MASANAWAHSEREVKRRRLMIAIAEYWLGHGHGPSLRELCQLADITSTSVLVHHLKSLQQSDLVEFSPRLARSVRLTARGQRFLVGGFDRSAPTLQVIGAAGVEGRGVIVLAAMWLPAEESPNPLCCQAPTSQQALTGCATMAAAMQKQWAQRWN